MTNGRSSTSRTSPRTSVPSPRTTSPRISVSRPSSSLRSVSSSIPARSAVSFSSSSSSSVSISRRLSSASSFSVSSSTFSLVGSPRILGHHRPGDSMPPGRKANLSLSLGGRGAVRSSRRIEEGGGDEEEEKLKKYEDEVEHYDYEKRKVNSGEEEEEQQMTVAVAATPNAAAAAAPSALSTSSGGSQLSEFRDTLTHLLWEMRNQREIFGRQVVKVKGLVDKLEATFDNELNISESYIELANAMEVDINGGSLTQSTRYSELSSSPSFFPKQEQQRHSKAYLQVEQTGEANAEKAEEKLRLPVITLSENAPAVIETSALHSRSNLSIRQAEVVASSVSATNAVSPTSVAHAPRASSSTIAISNTRAFHSVSHSSKRPTIPPLTNLPLPSTHPTSASATLSTSLHSVSLQTPSLFPISFSSLPITATTLSIPSHENYPKHTIDPKSPNQPLSSSSSSSSSSSPPSMHTPPLLSHRSFNVDVGLIKIESSSGSSPFPRTGGGEREKSLYSHSGSVQSYQPSLYSSSSQGSLLPILPLPFSKLPNPTEGSSSSSAIGSSSNRSSVPFTPPWKYRDDISVGEVSTFCPDLSSTYGSPDRATIYCTAMSTSSFLSPSLSFPSTSPVSPPSRSTTEALRQEVAHGTMNGSVFFQDDRRRPFSPGKEEMRRTMATSEFPHNDHHPQAEQQSLALPSLPLHSLLPEATAAPSRLSWREETRDLGKEATTSSTSLISTLPPLEERRISSMEPHPHAHFSSTTAVGTPRGEISGSNPLELLQCQIRQIRRAVRHGIPMGEAVEIIIGEGGGDFFSSWSENPRGSSSSSSTSISPPFPAWEKSNQNKSSSNSSSANSADGSQFDIYSPTPVSTARAKLLGGSLYAAGQDNREGFPLSPPGTTDASAEVAAHHPSFTREKRRSPSPFPMTTAAAPSLSAPSQLSSNTTISGTFDTFGRSSSLAGIVSSSSGSTVLGSLAFAASGRVEFSDGSSPFPVIVEKQDETVVVPTTVASIPVVPTIAVSTPVAPTTSASISVAPTTSASIPVVPTTAALTPVVPTAGVSTGSSSRSCPSSAVPHYVAFSPQSAELAPLDEPKKSGHVFSQRRLWSVSSGEMTPKGIQVNSTTERSSGCPATDDTISIKLRLNIPSVESTEFEGQGASEKPLEVRVLDPQTNALIRQPFQELSNKVNLHYPEQNIMTVLVQDGAETVAIVRVRVVEEEGNF